MIDLSSREAQSAFKKLQRTTFATNIMMCVVTVAATAIAIWGTATAKGRASWSEILFYILIALLAVYFIGILTWEIILRRKYAELMHKYIAEGFYARKNILNVKGHVAFDLSLAGDKISVMRENGGEYVQFDLAPVSRYPSVCANAVRLVKRFICGYYFKAAQQGDIDSVILYDKIQKRTKKYIYVENGKPKSKGKLSYFIRHGLINTD